MPYWYSWSLLPPGRTLSPCARALPSRRWSVQDQIVSQHEVVALTYTRSVAKIKWRTHTSRHFGLVYFAAWSSLSAPQKNDRLARAMRAALSWSQSCQREEVAAILRHSARAEPRGNTNKPEAQKRGQSSNAPCTSSCWVRAQEVTEDYHFFKLGLTLKKLGNNCSSLR